MYPPRGVALSHQPGCGSLREPEGDGSKWSHGRKGIEQTFTGSPYLWRDGDDAKTFVLTTASSTVRVSKPLQSTALSQSKRRRWARYWSALFIRAALFYIPCLSSCGSPFPPYALSYLHTGCHPFPWWYFWLISALAGHGLSDTRHSPCICGHWGDVIEEELHRCTTYFKNFKKKQWMRIRC